MSFTPISNTPPQYEENGIAASDFYIKFYESGTTTPTAMATDSTGTTLLDKCQLNTEGYPINGSGAVFIPHINVEYKIALFRNAADANANDLNNAAWDIDSLSPTLTTKEAQLSFPSLTDAILNGDFSVGDLVYTASYRSQSECATLGITYPDGGGADYVVEALGTPDGYGDHAAGAKQLTLNEPTISAEMLGAISGGIVDTTLGLIGAISFAIAKDKPIDFAGSYLTSGNIPDFHNVKKTGNGSVLRGSNEYFISPSESDTNTLFVDPVSGIDTNDGLSLSESYLTPQAAVDAFGYFGIVSTPVIVDIAAGETNGKLTIPARRFQSSGYLTIRGPSVATVQTAPLFSLDGTGISANSAIDCGAGNQVLLKDILFKNWTSLVDCTQIGVGGFLWAYNMQCLDGTARSLALADRSAALLLQGGIKDGGLIGVDVYAGSTATIGYNAVSTDTSTIIRNTTQAAAYLKSNAHCVSNYATYEDNATVVFGYHNSRFDTKGDDFKRNTRVFTMLGSYVSENISPASNYNYGTADANVIVWELTEYSSRDLYHRGGISPIDVYHSSVSTTITGTSGNTLARNMFNVEGYSFIGQGRYIEVECVVGGAGTGTKTARLQVGGVVIGTYTIPDGASTGIIKCTLWANNQTSSVAVNQTYGDIVLVSAIRSVPVIDWTVAQDIGLYLEVPTASSTAIMHQTKLMLVGT